MYGESSEEINDYLIQGRYVLTETTRGVYFDIPYYITPSEYKELSCMIDTLLSEGIEVLASIHNFNPITGKTIDGIKDVYKSDHDILTHIKNGAHIIDYDLPFGPEKILAEKEKTKTI